MGALIIAAGVVLGTAVGCDDEVQVPPPSAVSAGVVRLCGLVHDRLPARLHGQARRTTSPASPLTAAWGDPALALRCGVPRPAALRPTSQLAEVDGMAWLPDGTTYTLLGRAAYVEVTVPRTIQLPAEVLGELTPVLRAALPKRPDGTL